MKKYLVEFIGTFFLMLTIVLTVNSSMAEFAPIAIGIVLAAMIYAGMPVSGAHYNPAVSLTIWLLGRSKAKDLLWYIISQLLAGVIAAVLGIYLLRLMPDYSGIRSTGIIDFIPGSLAEFVGTFALIIVILWVAVAEQTKGNSYYGLAIGLIVVLCSYALGSVSGGAFNPAVALGMTMSGMAPWTNLVMFFAGQILAAIVASNLFHFTNKKSRISN